MFDYCLAPNVFGDGTGCDNMTCIIVQFNDVLKGMTLTKKREINEVDKPNSEDNTGSPQEKRSKLEEN